MRDAPPSLACIISMAWARRMGDPHAATRSTASTPRRFGRYSSSLPATMATTATVLHSRTV